MKKLRKVILVLVLSVTAVLFVRLGLTIIDVSKHTIITETMRFRVIADSFYVFFAVLVDVVLLVVLGERKEGTE